MTTKHGGFAEYTSLLKSSLAASNPAALSFEEVAAVPMASVMTLMGLHDKRRVKPGRKVLMSVASGGIGTFAVQMAKALGAIGQLDSWGTRCDETPIRD
jgi:NADPH:quinone reductase-like Zn-dependent oxidoreductase